ncbi:MAG: metallophosphoesterase [Vampirovibrionales bacterium]
MPKLKIKRLPSKTQMALTIPKVLEGHFFSHHMQGDLHVRLERVELPAKSLKAPVRLLHLSDVHLDWNTEAWLDALLPHIHRLCESYEIDAIVFTGDAIAFGQDYLPALTDWFKALPDLPCYGVMGNHDYYEASRGKAVKAALEAGGVHMLVNESHLHEFSETQGAVCFHGVDDFMKGHPDMAALIETAKQTPEHNHVLLVHNPAQMAEPLPWGAFDIALAGHTHGGQFRCPNWLAQLLTESPYIQNWYDIADASYSDEGCQLFVHYATGTASVPCPIRLPFMSRRLPISVPRWGLMSELVIQELVPQTQEP